MRCLRLFLTDPSSGSAPFLALLGQDGNQVHWHIPRKYTNRAPPQGDSPGQDTVQTTSAGVVRSVTPSPSKSMHSLPLTRTRRSGAGSGGRRITLAAILVPIS